MFGVRWEEMGVEKPGEGLTDRLVQGTVKFGGGSLMIWGCMFWEGPGYVMGGWMLIFLSAFWMMNFKHQSNSTTKNPQTSFFSRTMTPNTRAKRPKNGFKTVD